MFQLHGAGAAPSFDRPTVLPVRASFSERLDAVLSVLPTVAAVVLDPVVGAVSRQLDLDPDIQIRGVRLSDGRVMSLVAAPSGVWADPAGKAALLKLKLGAGVLGRRLLLLPETVLSREPLVSNAVLISRCEPIQVSPGNQFALLSALLENGGELPMSDAVDLMSRADDPVAAVLGLAARGIIRLDLNQPFGPGSRVFTASGRIRP